MAATSELSGFTVGVTADRRRTEQVVMLDRLGLSTIIGPAIRTLPLDGEDEALLGVTEALIADPPDVVVANTGLGMRSWFSAAASWGLEEDLTRALGSGRVVARGAKAAGAAQLAGLSVWWRPDEDRLSAVGDGLVEGEVAGRLAGVRVALQLHGDTEQSLGPRLEAAGAAVVEVPVYRWTLPEDRGPALRLIERCLEGGVDAVTFTAGPTVGNLLRIGADAGVGDDLLRAFSDRVVVACIGPVCAAEALRLGISDPIVPATWRLGSLVRAVAEGLWARRRVLCSDDRTLVVQGGAVVVDGAVVHLTDRERSVLAVLAGRAGATVTRPTLLGAVWGDLGTDPHALEAVVARLRAKLATFGSCLETVVRRGYRLDARVVEMSPVDPAASPLGRTGAHARL